MKLQVRNKTHQNIVKIHNGCSITNCFAPYFQHKQAITIVYNKIIDVLHVYIKYNIII